MSEPESFLLNVGRRIRTARLKLGWSQEKLGDQCGLDRTYIGGIERGERNLTILKLKLIAEHLSVQIDELVRDSDC